MKFRKEYQTYLLIVIAIITAGYFLKHFFFNKKKKVIEGQAGASTTTYYRIDFPDTFAATPQDLLKELILTQYDTVLTDNTTGIQYVKPDAKYDDLKALIPATLLMKDSNEVIIGLKVVGCTGNKLDFFNKEAAAAADTAAATADTATAAAAAYEYARLILSNTYKDNLNIKALIAATNLLTIIGQPDIINYSDLVVTTAKNAAKMAADSGVLEDAAYANYSANYAANLAKNAANSAADAKNAAGWAATAAGLQSSGLKSSSLGLMGLQSALLTVNLKENNNYKKVMAKYNNNPANMKAAFITAAGIIYQSMSLKL